MTSALVPLKRVSSIRVSNIDKKSVEGEQPVRLCNYTDVYYRDVIRPEQSFMAATATPEQASAFRLQAGDVVITKDSETADDIGAPTYVAASAPDLVCGYHLAMIRPEERVMQSRFLFWTMNSTVVREQLGVSATGVTRYGLRTDSIGGVSVPCPPLQQQHAIADFLDAETTRIDALIAKKRALDAFLDERAARRLNDLFATQHVVSPDGVPMGLPGFECVRLGYLARVQTGLTLDAQREIGATTSSWPYLRVANVQDGRLNLDQVKSVAVPRSLAVRCMLQTGDVLMTEGGDPDKLGRGAVWRGEINSCLHQNHIFAVRPDRSRLLPEYLALLTRTAYGRRYFEVTSSKATGIASTSTAKIAAFRVPLLALESQNDLVETYHRDQATADTIKASLGRQILLLQERRQALITAAVIGELDIPGVTG